MGQVKITVRVEDEIAQYVKEETKKRKMKNESEMWRVLIERGMIRNDDLNERINALIKLSAQTLCVSQVLLTDGVDESKNGTELLNVARADALELLKKLGAI